MIGVWLSITINRMLSDRASGQKARLYFCPKDVGPNVPKCVLCSCWLFELLECFLFVLGSYRWSHGSRIPTKRCSQSNPEGL